MTVAAILKEKGRETITADPDTTNLEIARALRKHGIGCIVICSGGNSDIAGIISERDLVNLIADRGPEVLNQPASTCMTTKVVTCQETDTLDMIMAEMTASRFRHMPVVRNNRLVGLISIGDVVKRRIAKAEMEAAAMRDYIATG